MTRKLFVWMVGALGLLVTMGGEAAPRAIASDLSAYDVIADSRLESCHDGDTCRFIRKNGRKLKIRLDGVDAPERGAPFAKEAREFTVSFLKEKNVELRCSGKKSFDRRVCKVNVGGQDLGSELVKQGLAWDAPRFSKGRYQSEQTLAMQEKRGLWTQDKVESPTCQRRQSKRAKQNCPLNPAYQE